MNRHAEQRMLLVEEIHRIVARAKRHGMTLNTSRHAAFLVMAYPDACWPRRHVIDEIVAAAAIAKVPVEFERTG